MELETTITVKPVLDTVVRSFGLSSLQATHYWLEKHQYLFMQETLLAMLSLLTVGSIHG
jgi:hypothetical protein